MVMPEAAYERLHCFAAKFSRITLNEDGFAKMA
jgi:hypothetical protein